mmetsp:Transcript_35135/g.30997  ORF Transcript_35135/g.30997 Transcript_35135/m.30997 type:complete len:121 (+) Transcript_35135:103-465(+)
MLKYLLLLVSAIIAVIYAQTQCDCELGVYLKNVNGKCSGEVKHFDTPAFGLGCLAVFGDLDDSVECDACTQKGLNVTFYRDNACSKKLFEDFLPTGECHTVDLDNHTLALMTKCGETRYM